jgi:hypothetical protein
MLNPKLHQLLRAHGLDACILALRIGSAKTHVSQILNNVPGRGAHTRRKLARELADVPGALEMLGWDAKGKLLNPPNVLCGTNSHVEQTAPFDAESEGTRNYEATKAELFKGLPNRKELTPCNTAHS